MSEIKLDQTPSELLTLGERGYKLLNELGEGAFAKVFLSEYKPNDDPDSTIKLACKIVNTANAPKDIVRKFFPRELDILVKLNHPHVVQVHSIFQRHTKYYIFMRFAENGDLLQFILKNGPVGECQARIWLRQLALGLQYLHEMEIAHRDIKCENVLLTTNFNVKLADFGFARYVTDIRGKRVMSDTFCGSLLYAAPEILRGTPYNPKISDVWSLGVILYIMLNKSMPFDETNLTRLYELQTNKRWKFRRKIDDELSDCVKRLVSNLLEPDTTKRWKTDQIVHSSWIAMDPKLAVLSPTEQAALDNAIEERKKIMSEQKKTPKIQKINFKIANENVNNSDKNDSDTVNINIIKDVDNKSITPSIVQGDLLETIKPLTVEK